MIVAWKTLSVIWVISGLVALYRSSPESEWWLVYYVNAFLSQIIAEMIESRKSGGAK